MIVVFKDYSTEKIIKQYETDFKFEVGQVFKGFWGADSEVKKVELTMELDTSHTYSHFLQVVQIVYVERKFYEF